MKIYSFWICLFLLSFAACKTTDAPATETSTTALSTKATLPPPTSSSAANTKANTARTSAPSLSQEDQYRFKAFVKQGDAKYQAGEYRQALDFYKKAKAIAPEQIKNEKLVACLKALQEPSTREGR